MVSPPATRQGALVLRRTWWCWTVTWLLAVAAGSGTSSFCLPADACWPAAADWAALNATVGGRLISRAAATTTAVNSSTPTATNAISTTNSTASYHTASAMVYPNWQYAAGHTASPLALPEMVVAAATAADVQAALRFAAAHGIRVAVKSSGHSLTGRSTAAGALLVYLAGMQDMTHQAAFDDRCGGAPRPAITVQPGVTFEHLYAFADSVGGVVVGGGGPTVGAAGGYLLGGGHSPLGRALGLGVDNVLSLDVVLPNSTLVTVTSCAFPDLWWGLRGGGGGSFGVVVAATHRLHPEPGVVHLAASYPMGSSGGGNVSAWFADVVVAQPNISAGWTCYIQCLPALAAVADLATWNLSCVHYGNDTDAAAAGIAALRGAFDAHPSPRQTWDMQAYPTFWAWKRGDNGGATTGVASVVSSRIFPAAFLGARTSATALATTVLAGVRDGVNMQIGLLLGGAVASGEGGAAHGGGAAALGGGAAALGEGASDGVGAAASTSASLSSGGGSDADAGRSVGGGGGGSGDHGTANASTAAVSQWMRGGLWHLIGGGGWVDAVTPDVLQQAAAARVRAFGTALRALDPAGGAYLNEDDFEEPNWQTSFFGSADTYARLLALKRQVDPHGLLCCHKCVGDGDVGNCTAIATTAVGATARPH